MSADGGERAFATLQVAGDRLNPRAVTDLLGLEPTFSARKGERYRRGRLEREYTARTGVWNLSTRHSVQSSRLQDHLDALKALLAMRSSRLADLRDLVQEHGCWAGVSCYWHGSAGTVEPSVPNDFRELIGRFGGEIETDFYREDDAEAQSAAE